MATTGSSDKSEVGYMSESGLRQGFQQESLADFMGSVFSAPSEAVKVMFASKNAGAQDKGADEEYDKNDAELTTNTVHINASILTNNLDFFVKALARRENMVTREAQEMTVCLDSDEKEPFKLILGWIMVRNLNTNLDGMPLSLGTWIKVLRLADFLQLKSINDLVSSAEVYMRKYLSYRREGVRPRHLHRVFEIPESRARDRILSVFADAAVRPCLTVGRHVDDARKKGFRRTGSRGHRIEKTQKNAQPSKEITFSNAYTDYLIEQEPQFAPWVYKAMMVTLKDCVIIRSSTMDDNSEMVKYYKDPLTEEGGIDEWFRM